MTLTKLAKIFASKNIHFILVKDISAHRNNLTFIGSLDEYLEAIEVLGGRAIFVSTISITEEHFNYVPNKTVLDSSAISPFQTHQSPTVWPHPTNNHAVEGDAGEEGVEEIQEFDLCSVVPELKNFKKRIGEDGYFELSACNLTYSIYEEWAQEMWILHTNAREIIDQQLLAGWESVEAEKSLKWEGVIKKLQALISDKDFVRLPTQRAMSVYAIDKIPELENLDEALLKLEIQDLAAKIQARSLKRN